MRLASGLAVTLLCCVADAQAVPTAPAVPLTIPTAMQLPFAEASPAVDRERDEIFVVVLGGADERRGPLSASRLSARRLAEQSGRDRLHAFIDSSVATAHLTPSVLASLHAAIDREARVASTRPRVDGSANVRISIPLSRLREITGSVRGLPWSQ